MLELQRPARLTPIARFACAALLAWSTAGLPVLAQEPPRSLTVNGQGQIAIPATIAQVSLGVEIRARTAEDAQEQVAAASQAIVTYLKANNVEDLQTQGIQLSPIYVNENGRSRISDYSASNTVSFRISADELGEILDEAVQRGATRIAGLSFVGSDEDIAAARNAALRVATFDARTQADIVLGALGLPTGEVARINIGYATPLAPESIRNMAPATGDIMARSAVEGGEQTIQASVMMVIHY